MEYNIIIREGYIEATYSGKFDYSTASSETKYLMQIAAGHASNALLIDQRELTGEILAAQADLLLAILKRYISRYFLFFDHCFYIALVHGQMDLHTLSPGINEWFDGRVVLNVEPDFDKALEWLFLRMHQPQAVLSSAS